MGFWPSFRCSMGTARNKRASALAERLCRMSAATLRGMLKADDAELRRAAALACAMKDDKDHIPDLIAALEDKDGDVVKAARGRVEEPDRERLRHRARVATGTRREEVTRPRWLKAGAPWYGS